MPDERRPQPGFWTPYRGVGPTLFRNMQWLSDVLEPVRAAHFPSLGLLAPSAEGKGIENPVTVFGQAISAKQTQPVAELNNLWNVVENAPKTWTNPTTKLTYTKEDAVEGFKSALLQAVFAKAKDRDGDVSARTAYLNLFGTLEG